MCRFFKGLKGFPYLWSKINYNNIEDKRGKLNMMLMMMVMGVAQVISPLVNQGADSMLTHYSETRE